MKVLKTVANSVGVDGEKIRWWSVEKAAREQKLDSLASRLTEIVPDISKQETSFVADEFNSFKKRMQQAFQCRMMLNLLGRLDKRDKYTVVDIGDSAGTHMLYLQHLIDDKFEGDVALDTISVNLDPVAVEKVKERGLKAVLCRAENLELNDEIDFYTSFEMIEHLHNPAIFLHNLAQKGTGKHMVITVPYLRKSRVGLHNVRAGRLQPIIAEEEHVFELSPDDWSLLFLHSGWRVVHSEIYHQYPTQIPAVSRYLQSFWQKSDFEGFWGAVLERDTSFSDSYQDWEN